MLPCVSRLLDYLDNEDRQFLEVAISNVVARPVWHRIELDAMRELHVAGAKEPEKLL